MNDGLDDKLKKVIMSYALEIEEASFSPSYPVKLNKDIKQLFANTINSVIRKQPYTADDFETGWNNALWALLDELGLGEEN